MKKYENSLAEAGHLHFDVTRGASGESLIAALLDLGASVEWIPPSLLQMGLGHVKIQASYNQKGPVCATQFCFSPHGDEPIPSSWQPMAPLQPTPTTSSPVLREEEPLSTLQEARLRLLKTQLSPVAVGIAEKALRLLGEALEAVVGESAQEYRINEDFLEPIVANIVVCAVLMDHLSPVEISATPIPISAVFQEKGPQALGLDIKKWALALSQGIPTREVDCTEVLADLAGICLLKAVSSRFGVRAQGVLLRIGTGTKDFMGKCMCLALWCEPKPFATRLIVGPSAQPLTLPCIRLEALCPKFIDLPDLKTQLEQLGIRTCVAEPVMDWTQSRCRISVVVPSAQVQAVLTLFFKEGQAEEVLSFPVEVQALQSRIVVVPFGRGQKEHSCRVKEWALGQTILRAEPLKEDIQEIAHKTDWGLDAIRMDVLAAWKRWRT